MTTVQAKFRVRRGTAASWTSGNPLLLLGEEGYETDTRRRKVGDGVSRWNVLSYTMDGVALQSELAGTNGGQSVGYSLGLSGSVSSTHKRKADQHPTVWDFMSGAEQNDCKSGAKTLDVHVALNNAFAQGVHELPAGVYLCAGNVTTAAADYAGLRGKGIGRTVLHFTSGGLQVPVSGFTRYHATQVENLSIETTSVGADVGLHVYRSGASSESRTVLRNLEIVGADGVHGGAGGPEQFWDTMLRLTSVRFVAMDKLMLAGGDPGNTDCGIDIVAADDGSDPGFHYTLAHTSINGCTVGARATGWIEGLYWGKSEIFGCRDGFVATHTGTSVGTFLMSEMHINGSRDVFKTTNVSNIGLHNMSLNRGVIEPGGGHFAGSVIDITGNGNDDNLSISGCKVFSAFDDTTSSVKLNNVCKYSINGLSIYGGASVAALHLTGTTRRGSYDQVVIDSNGATLAVGEKLDSSVTDTDRGMVTTTGAATAIVDAADALGKTQPGFSAYLTSTAVNCTGDATDFQVIAATVSHNRGAAWNTTTGVFTAPVAGEYEFCIKATIQGHFTGHVDGSVNIVLPGRTSALAFNPYAESAGSTMSKVHAVKAVLAAADTVTFVVRISGSTKTVSLTGTIGQTEVSGSLVRRL